jgi:glutamate 5-kinase
LARRQSIERYGRLAGELLITHHDIEDRREKRLLRSAFEGCLELGIVPVGNENNAVADVELAQYHYGGENDGIGSHVARFLHAYAHISQIQIKEVWLGIKARTINV